MSRAVGVRGWTCMRITRQRSCTVSLVVSTTLHYTAVQCSALVCPGLLRTALHIDAVHGKVSFHSHEERFVGHFVSTLTQSLVRAGREIMVWTYGTELGWTMIARFI